MPNWTITGGTFSATTFAAANITGCAFTRENGMRDSCSFFIPATVNPATPPLDELDDFSLLYDGTVHWAGYVEEINAVLEPGREGWAVKGAGGGMKLDRLIFTQQRMVASDPGDPEYVLVSDVLLGIADDGGRLTIAGTIENVIDSTASDHGLTSGTILTDFTVYAPLTEMQESTVWEVLHRLMGWCPEAVLYFDHAAGSVNVLKTAALSSVSTASTGTGGADGKGVVKLLNNHRRHHPVPGVQIVWETVGSFEGTEMLDVTIDTAGASTGLDRLVQTIRLDGRHLETQEQEVKTDPIPRVVEDFDDGEWMDFLRKKVPELSQWDTEEAALEVYECVHTVDTANKLGQGDVPEADEEPYYPRELVNGTVPMWETTLSTAPVEIRVTVRPGADAAERPDLRRIFGVAPRVWKREFLIRVQGTDATSRTYRRVLRDDPGEEPPTGLAAAWLAALNVTAPAYQIVFTGSEPRLDIWPGKKLTLTGDVAVSNAVVQAVTVDVDAGRVTVTTGPQSIRTPRDLVALARAANRRSPSVQRAENNRTTAEPAGRVAKGPAGTANSSAGAMPQEPPSPPAFVELRAPGKIDISAGCLLVTQLGTLDESDPVPDKTLKVLKAGSNFLPAAVTNATINDGETVWIQLTYTQSETGTAVVSRHYQCDDAEYVISEEVTDDDTTAHIPLAAYTETSGTPSLAYFHTGGPLTAPTLSLAYQDPESDSLFSAYFRATLTAPGEVTIGEGWINYDNIGTEGAPPGLTSGHTGTLPAVFDGLEDAQFIWLRISRGGYTTPDENWEANNEVDYTGRGRAYVYASYALENGNEVPDPDDQEIYIPICWFDGSQVHQLHIGAAVCPGVFTYGITHED